MPHQSQNIQDGSNLHRSNQILLSQVRHSQLMLGYRQSQFNQQLSRVFLRKHRKHPPRSNQTEFPYQIIMKPLTVITAIIQQRTISASNTLTLITSTSNMISMMTMSNYLSLHKTMMSGILIQTKTDTHSPRAQESILMQVSGNLLKAP